MFISQESFCITYLKVLFLRKTTTTTTSSAEHFHRYMGAGIVGQNAETK